MLDAALAAVGVGTWQMDVEAGRAVWDAVTSRLCGLESVERSVEGFLPVHPDDRDVVIQSTRECLRSGKLHDLEFRVVWPNGEIRWLHGVASRLETPGATPRYLVGIASDITERKLSETRLRSALESTLDCVTVVDRDWRITFLNQRAKAEIAQGRDVIGQSHWEAFPDSRSNIAGHYYRLVMSDRVPRSFEVHYAPLDAWYEVNVAPVDDGIAIFFRNITERKTAANALRESEERFRIAVNVAALGIADVDPVTHELQWSDRMKEMLGLPLDVKPSYDLYLSLVHPDDKPRIEAHVQAVLARTPGFEATDTIRIIRASDGALRWHARHFHEIRNDLGKLTRIVFVSRDVTEEKQSENRVRWAAEHDPLTQLANRSLFSEELSDAIARATSNRRKVALLHLDVDNFKQINDSLGHDAGDALLKAFADRLRSSVRGTDTIARLGGDEFAVVLPGLSCDADLTKLIDAILRRMREPFVHAGQILDCRASIGASIYPQHGKTAEELLKAADVALYIAKASQRGGSVVFEPGQRKELQQRALMIATARDIVANDRVVPFYQPKVELGSRRVIGFEALARLQNQHGGISSPETIAAAFEDLDVAVAIGERVIEHVIADMQGWLERDVPFGHLAINASAAEFRRDDFAERLLERLAQANVPAKYIQLEVTETVFLGRGAENVGRALDLLSSEGIRIALDDFGTGYASLRHLKQFPVHELKIDRSFVRDIDTDADDAAIIQALLDLGRSLDIDVIAEGVETESHAEHLMRLGCRYGQGFLFSKAVPAGRVPRLVAGSRPASD